MSINVFIYKLKSLSKPWPYQNSFTTQTWVAPYQLRNTVTPESRIKPAWCCPAPKCALEAAH